MRFEKGTPLRWRYQNDLYEQQTIVSDGSMRMTQYTHGHRAQRLEDPEESVSVQHESPVYQVLRLDITGRPFEQIRLRRL